MPEELVQAYITVLLQYKKGVTLGSAGIRYRKNKKTQGKQALDPFSSTTSLQMDPYSVPPLKLWQAASPPSLPAALHLRPTSTPPSNLLPLATDEDFWQLEEALLLCLLMLETCSKGTFLRTTASSELKSQQMKFLKQTREHNRLPTAFVSSQ